MPSYTQGVSQVAVIGSSRAVAGIGATIYRVREALATAGIELADASSIDESDGASLRVVVDPAAWFAAQATAPSARWLAQSVGFSIAPYGSPAMQDDAEVGRLLGAMAHPEARSADHLIRVGCRAAHVALGCRPVASVVDAHASDVHLVTFGPSTARRLRVVAHGAPWCDALRCAHHFDRELPADEASRGIDHPFACATVLVDIAADDDAAPDLPVLLEALESGTAVVTERLGCLLPADAGQSVVRAPWETLFARANELAEDPRRAQALVAADHQATAEAWPLLAMGEKLAELLRDARNQPPPLGDQHVQLSPHAAPAPARRPVARILSDESRRPDAAVRHGVQKALNRLQRLERRIARVERAGMSDETEVLRACSADAEYAVSVLVPSFTARRWVLAALGSVAATAAEPDAPSLELIIVDDGSPQDDGAAAVAWAGERPGLAVTVLRHPVNLGLGAARNTALSWATGACVVALDADNLLRPRGLRKLVTALDARPDADFAYGVLEEFDTQGPIGLRGLYPWEPQRLRYGNYIDALSLIRRDVLLEMGGFTVDMPEQGFEDWDLWCRFAERDAVGVWVPEIVASYRVRADSMSADLHLSHVAPLADLIERHPDLFR